MAFVSLFMSRSGEFLVLKNGQIIHGTTSISLEPFDIVESYRENTDCWRQCWKCWGKSQVFQAFFLTLMVTVFVVDSTELTNGDGQNGQSRASERGVSGSIRKSFDNLGIFSSINTYINITLLLQDPQPTNKQSKTYPSLGNLKYTSKI